MLLWIGIVGLAVSLLAAATSRTSNSGLYVAGGMIGLLQGIVAFYLFNGFAELLRILKRQNGIPYGGQILLPTPVYDMVCSECGSNAASSLNRGCPDCGAKFESDSK